MRVHTYLAIASFASAVYASAIPSAIHGHFHKLKRNINPLKVETVTQTVYQTVVWVDADGRPVSTEVNTPPVGAATPSSPPTSQGQGVGYSPPAQAYAWEGQNRRPNGQSQEFQRSEATVPSTPVSKEDEFKGAPSNSKSSPPSSSGINQDSGVPSVGSPESGSSNNGNAAPGGMGVCYDMIDSQTKCKTPSTINAEFSFLKSQGYGTVRIYDIGCPVNDFASAAAQNGLRLMAGINTIGNLQGDLDKLIGMVNGNWGPIDTIYIGNELVNSGSASAAQVAGAVTTARGILSGAGYKGNVVTVDTFNQMVNDPTICSTSDYCAANTHAFFDPNTQASGAGAFVLKAYNQVASRNGGKRVVITESGWPWQGSCNQQACPGVENQKAAMNSIMQSFSGQASNLFLFQAYNAGYKQPGQFGVEQFFGVYDADHYKGGIGSAAS